MTTKNQPQSNLIAEALLATLISPNELDRNLEAANVVDGLFAIARALHHCAQALEGLGLKDAATPMGALADRTEFTEPD